MANNILSFFDSLFEDKFRFGKCFLKKNTFHDRETENSYILHEDTEWIFYKKLFDAIHISSFIFGLIYTYFTYFQFFFLIFSIFSVLFTLFLIYSSYKLDQFKSPRLYRVTIYTQIFILGIHFNLIAIKNLLMNVDFNENIDSNNGFSNFSKNSEIKCDFHIAERLYIFNSFLICLINLLKFGGSFFYFFLMNLFNFIMIVLQQLKSKDNSKFFFDIILIFFINFSFCFQNKIFEIKSRQYFCTIKKLHFIDKYFYDIILDSDLYIFIKNKKYFSSKFCTIKMITENENIKNSEDSSKLKSYTDQINENKEMTLYVDQIKKDLIKEENVFFRNEDFKCQTNLQKKDTSISIIDNFNSFQFILNSYDSIEQKLKEKNKDKSLFFVNNSIHANENIENNINIDKKLISGKVHQKLKKGINKNYSDIAGNMNHKNRTSFLFDDKNFLNTIKTKKNEEDAMKNKKLSDEDNDTEIIEILKNFYLIKENDYQGINFIDKYLISEEILFDVINKINIYKGKQKSLMEIMNSETFQTNEDYLSKSEFLGTYVHLNHDKNSKIHIKKKLNNFKIYNVSHKILNVEFYGNLDYLKFVDVTEIYRIYNLSKIKSNKEKILNKIKSEIDLVLEFLNKFAFNAKKIYKINKNSINSDFKQLKDSEYMMNKKAFTLKKESSNLDISNIGTIKNFINLMKFSNQKFGYICNESEILSENIENKQDKISLKNITNFSKNILNTLLIFYSKKNLQLKLEFEIENEIEFSSITTDIAKLKFILFSILSNAINFTNSGKIKFLCSSKIHESKLINNFNNYKIFTGGSMEISKKLVDFLGENKNPLFRASLINNHSNLRETIKSIQIKIIDTGIGIKDEEIPKVLAVSNQNFQPDYVGDKGIGLLICKKLSDELGIKISLESKYQEGSTFTLDIPSNLVHFSNIIESKINDSSEDFFSEELCDKLSPYLDEKSSKELKKSSIAFKYIIEKNATSNSNDKFINQESNRKLIKVVKSKKSSSINMNNSNATNKFLVPINASGETAKYFTLHNSSVNSGKTKNKINRNKFKKDHVVTFKNQSHDATSNFSTVVKSPIIMTSLNAVVSNPSSYEDLSNESTPKRGRSPILSHLMRIKKPKRLGLKMEREKILLADNNMIEIQSSKITLMQYISGNSLNYDVILCYDGVEILRNVLNEKTRKKIRYIITEDKMENLDGIDVLSIVKILQKRKFLKKVDLIFLTSDEDLKYFEFLRQSGAEYIFNKPLSKNNLNDIITI